MVSRVHSTEPRKSHALSDADFEALREAFEAALRRQQTDRFR
jgi:hypothetical protein